MGRHSKHNTSRGDFTYAEYSMLKGRWGTQRGRLNAESVRSFDACALCLSRAREPVVCGEGHLFCRECILADLLEQRSEEERVAREVVRREAKERAEREQQQAQERERQLAQFEKTQLAGAKRGPETPDERESKRKRMPAYWIPEMAPSAKEDAPKAPEKKGTICKPGVHRLTMKHLTSVKFVSSEKDESICPGCKRTLTLSSVLSVLKPCGHIHCSRCIDEIIQPSKEPSCTACEAPLKQKDGQVRSDQLIRLVREGTGFAAGGAIEVEKQGVAFQG